MTSVPQQQGHVWDLWQPTDGRHRDQVSILQGREVSTVCFGVLLTGDGASGEHPGRERDVCQVVASEPALPSVDLAELDLSGEGCGFLMRPSSLPWQSLGQVPLAVTVPFL